MKETWRWYGPQDPVPLDHVKQAGGHRNCHRSPPHVWRRSLAPARKSFAEKMKSWPRGLVWSVVESIPVHNSIKLRTGPVPSICRRRGKIARRDRQSRRAK